MFAVVQNENDDTERQTRKQENQSVKLGTMLRRANMRLCAKSTWFDRPQIMFSGITITTSGKERSFVAPDFCDIKHDATLALPQVPMSPAMQVFAGLKIDDQILSGNKALPGDDRFVFDHCRIEEVMDQLDHGAFEDRSGFPEDSLSEREFSSLVYNMRYHAENAGRARDKVADINREMVDALSALRRGRKTDACAQTLLKLCGFNDLTAFRISEEEAQSEFRVVQATPSGEFMILVHSMAEGEPSENMRRDRLAQIACELLRQLSANRDKKVFRPLFALRLINEHAAFFRIDANERTLKTLLETQRDPKEKLQLLSSIAQPIQNRGWSLIDDAERLQALRPPT